MKQVQGIEVLETLQEIADPRHTALLVIDVQNDNASPRGFLASNGRDISWIRQAVPRIRMVLEEARRLGLLVLFMRMTKSRDGSHESGTRLRGLGKTAHVREGVLQYELEGTWGNEVLDELEPRPNERQIIKYRASAFIATPLEMILKSRGIKAAAVVGLVTEGCVMSTVRDLDHYGYYPVVLSDCVASSRDDLHRAALLLMSARFDVVTSEEILAVWRDSAV